MKTNNQAHLPKITSPLLHILIVEDDEPFLHQAVEFFRERCSGDYEVHVDLAKTRKEGRECLNKALVRGQPYDIVILDYELPDTEGSKVVKKLDLVQFVVENPSCSKWVGLLTAYASDRGLVDPYAQQAFRDFNGQLLDKSDIEVWNAITEAALYHEVKEPLRSDWLPMELGAVPKPLVRVGIAVPAGFNVYNFIQRLGNIWPKLDPQTREQANRLFDIEAGDGEGQGPRRIGFKVF